MTHMNYRRPQPSDPYASLAPMYRITWEGNTPTATVLPAPIPTKYRMIANVVTPTGEHVQYPICITTDFADDRLRMEAIACAELEKKGLYPTGEFTHYNDLLKTWDEIGDFGEYHATLAQFNSLWDALAAGQADVDALVHQIRMPGM